MAELLDEKFWKNSWANSNITSRHWFFFSSWNRFLAELWPGESDGETVGVLILLAASVEFVGIFLVDWFVSPVLTAPGEHILLRALHIDLFSSKKFARTSCYLQPNASTWTNNLSAHSLPLPLLLFRCPAHLHSATGRRCCLISTVTPSGTLLQTATARRRSRVCVTPDATVDPPFSARGPCCDVQLTRSWLNYKENRFTGRYLDIKSVDLSWRFF